jgi:cytochrome P450
LLSSLTAAKGPGYRAFLQGGKYHRVASFQFWPHNTHPGLSLLGVNASGLVAIMDEYTHGRYRRPVAHAYSLSSLKGYEPYIDEMIQKLVDVLDEAAISGRTINMSDWLHYCM